MQHTVTHRGVPHTLDAIEPTPGLRVYKHPYREYGIGTYPVVLAHHSGRTLALLESTHDAVNAALDLADYADWAKPADELTADKQLADRVHALLEMQNAIDTGIKYTD